MIDLEILENLVNSLSYFYFFKQVCLVKSKMWPFFKQSLTFFSRNLLATLILCPT